MHKVVRNYVPMHIQNLKGGITKSRAPQSLLMRGYRKEQLIHQPARAQDARWERPLKMCQWIMEDTARRVAESRKHFGEKFFRGDFHSHTQHSDGIGTVAETAQMAKICELDFQFVTDHWGITQARECRQHGLWYGQEPKTLPHHMLILGLEHAFTPVKNFLVDMAAARSQGATVCVPHPAGWWPYVSYDEETKSLLEKLPEPILMEIRNGANNMVSPTDYTDENAVRLWDRLLGMGKVVYAQGNTDAHAPHCLGMVWNGVFATRCTQPSILKALTQGRNFVSEAPLVSLGVGDVPMGGFVRKNRPSETLHLKAVDSRGLEKVVLIVDGKAHKQWSLEGRTQFETALPLPPHTKRYIRMEAVARDAKHAFTNPIFIR